LQNNPQLKHGEAIMAQFINYNVGQFWGASLGDPLSSNAQLLYVEADNVGFLCEDGTYVYLHGTGFTYTTDAEGVVRLTGANVTSVEHYTSTGEFISHTLDIAGADGTGATLYDSRWSAIKSDGLRTISALEYNAFAGDDILDARTRLNNAIIDDTLNGWNGNDRMYGGSGNDLLSGDAGNDRLFGGAGADKLAGGSGNDLLTGGNGNDLLSGGAGNDSLVGNTGVDTAFYLGKFSDLAISQTATGFVVQSGENGIDTLTGIERIATNDGVYRFDATSGNWVKQTNAQQSLMLADTLATENGSVGNDSFQSGVSGPVFTNQPSLDLIFGGDGDDSYVFGASFGILATRHNHGMIYGYGGAGNDTFHVQTVQDYLLTQPSGNFHFFGEAGNDILTGGRSADELNGGTGNDTLNGGGDSDVLTGGAGADVFSFVNFAAPNPRYYDIKSGNDIITDFEVGVDVLKYNAPTTFTFEETSDGTLITAMTATSGPGPFTSTVLLQGVFGLHSVDDLLFV
jgi:Ca2+-binding RTX toxin-like protein